MEKNTWNSANLHKCSEKTSNTENKLKSKVSQGKFSGCLNLAKICWFSKEEISKNIYTHGQLIWSGQSLMWHIFAELWGSEGADYWVCGPDWHAQSENIIPGIWQFNIWTSSLYCHHESRGEGWIPMLWIWLAKIWRETSGLALRKQFKGNKSVVTGGVRYRRKLRGSI